MKVYEGIYEEAAPLYKALAKASLKAKEDPDWSHIRDRINEVTTKYEELIRLEKILGWNNYRGFSSLITQIGESEEGWEIIDRLLQLEESINKYLVSARIAYNYVLKSRIASFLTVLLASVLVALNSIRFDVFVLSLAAAGLALSAFMLLFHRLAAIPVIVADILLASTLALGGYTGMIAISVIVAILATFLTAPLPIALERLFLAKGGGSDRYL
ncbi:MAG: hypothetical protein F7C82_01015 [Desulfurococcales archaeon]|nr:hypothetical protein [Desulfurococcales archaeon]MCE4628842.1 hypothetical protein [Desulfurococcales archaeon]